MATGSFSILLVGQSGLNQGQTFAIQDIPQTIGRGSGNDITIIEPSLARQHARIWLAPDGFVVEDLGSTSGTFVNGQRVTSPTRLRSGDTLQLGHVLIFSVQASKFNSDDQETVAGRSIPADVIRPLPPPVPPPPLSPPIHPRSTQARSPWFWVSIGVVIAILIIGPPLAALAYFLNIALIPPVIEATPVAKASRLQPEPTHTPTATDIPTFTPTSTSTPLPAPTLEATVVVPGIPALAAEEQVEPKDIKKIDAFCNSQIEVKSNEPIVIGWEQRVAGEGETDYLGQWLENVYYDVRLDGVPITELSPLNYFRSEACGDDGLCGPILNFWVNVGLLDLGTHHLSLEWYTVRAISNGFDRDPADGELDIFGPGQAGTGFCDIAVVEAATPTPTPTSTLTPTPTPLPTSTPLPIPTPLPAFPLGVFQDFEDQSSWRRGDEPYGEFTYATAQVHGGNYAGQLTYNFPPVDKDYVVFLQSRRLAGQPSAISAWVYGDNSGNYLNVWIKDGGGEIWQMTFGRIQHTGWQQMTAQPSGDWPSGPVSNPNNGSIDYPVTFYALVLDHIPDGSGGSGAIYIDDLSSQ
jgi:hypothetical protein